MRSFLSVSYISLTIVLLFAVFAIFINRSAAQNREILDTSKIPDAIIDDDSSNDANDTGLDNSDQIFKDFSEENLFQTETKISTDNRLYQQWLKFRNYFNSRLTLDYEHAYQFGEPKRTIMNRTSMRIEMERLFGDSSYVKIDGKITALLPEDHLARARNEKFRIDSYLREAYLETSSDNITIKAGKQILIWGESDTAIVTDLVSPRDTSELNFKSIEDSRVSQNMLSVDLYSTLGSLGIFVNPDPETDEFPEKGSEYYAEPKILGVGEIKDDKPRLGDTEYGGCWRKTFGQSDISVMAADLIENKPIITIQGSNDNVQKELVKEYRRFPMLGVTGNLSKRNFIWKSELAYSWDRPYQKDILNAGEEIAKKDTFDIAFGFEFSSTSRLWNVTMEMANKHIRQWENNLVNNRRNESAIIFIVSKKFLNETFNVEYTILSQFPSSDTFQKLKAEYELNDNLSWELEFGRFTSQKESGPYWEYRNKQRVFVSIKLQI